MEKVLDLKNYDLFIVDFDGTIVDTMKMWKYICLDFVKSLNYEVKEGFYEKISSRTNKEITDFSDVVFKRI